MKTAADIMPWMLTSQTPKTNWKQIQPLVAAAREWQADNKPGERHRKAHGRLLQAYAAGKPEPVGEAQQAVAWAFNEYFQACEQTHPRQVTVADPLSQSELVQWEVWETLFLLIDQPMLDKTHEFLTPAIPHWHSRIAQMKLVRDLLGQTSVSFAELVQSMNQAVNRHPTEVIPGLLDLLSWQAEFWETSAWSSSGPFRGWPQEYVQTVGLDVELRRLTGRFWGIDQPFQQNRLPDQPQPETDPLLGWVEVQVKNRQPASLQTVYLAAAQALSEADLYLVPMVDPKTPNATAKTLEITQATDQQYLLVLESLQQLKASVATAPAARDLIVATQEHYRQLEQIGPLHDVPTADEKNFYDLGDFTPWLALLQRMGSLPRLDDKTSLDVGSWRQRPAGTLYWLAAARAHEQLGERAY